jgi:hypothetical protein
VIIIGCERKPAFNRLSVKQLNLDGKLNKIWGSILEAEKETNSSSKIVLLKGTRKTHNGFKWEYN